MFSVHWFFPRTDNGYWWYSLFPLIQHLHMMVKLLRLDSKLQDLRRKKIFNFDKQCSHQGICLKVAKMLHCVMGKIILAGSFSHCMCVSLCVYICFIIQSIHCWLLNICTVCHICTEHILSLRQHNMTPIYTACPLYYVV